MCRFLRASFQIVSLNLRPLLNSRLPMEHLRSKRFHHRTYRSFKHTITRFFFIPTHLPNSHLFLHATFPASFLNNIFPLCFALPLL